MQQIAEPPFVRELSLRWFFTPVSLNTETLPIRELSVDSRNAHLNIETDPISLLTLTFFLIPLSFVFCPTHFGLPLPFLLFPLYSLSPFFSLCYSVFLLPLFCLFPLVFSCIKFSFPSFLLSATSFPFPFFSSPPTSSRRSFRFSLLFFPLLFLLSHLSILWSRLDV